jgi:hypothetical protein
MIVIAIDYASEEWRWLYHWRSLLAKNSEPGSGSGPFVDAVAGVRPTGVHCSQAFGVSIWDAAVVVSLLAAEIVSEISAHLQDSMQGRDGPESLD